MWLPSSPRTIVAWCKVLRLTRADNTLEEILNPKYGACPSTGRLNKLRHININSRCKNSDNLKLIRPQEEQEECKAVKVCVVVVHQAEVDAVEAALQAVEVALQAVAAVLVVLQVADQEVNADLQAVDQVVQELQQEAEAVDPWAA